MTQSYVWTKDREVGMVWLEGYYPKVVNDFQVWQDQWSPTPLGSHTYFPANDYTEAQVRERLESETG